MSYVERAAVLTSSGFRAQTLNELRQDFEVLDIHDPRAAIEHLRLARPLPEAVVVGYARATSEATDVGAGRMPAHVTLEQIHDLDPDLPVIVSTSEVRLEVIVDLVRRGAFDYVAEPRANSGDPQAHQQHAQELRLALERAVRWRRTVLENRRLRQQSLPNVESPVAQAPAMLRVIDLARKVAPTSATVLITGESGTGKEIVARLVHRLSTRDAEPFLAINCGAMSDALLSSELFGHARGAFTGADRDQPGLLQQVGKGSLVLDELSTISEAMQVTLLRVLEQRTARAVGGRQEYPVQCRFIAAANRDLGRMVQQGEFREDLYYRLNVLHLHVPPLRDRPEDIAPLAQHFLAETAKTHGRNIQALEPEAMRELERSPWPGNVRQLRNTIERAVILAERQRIRRRDLNLTDLAPNPSWPSNTGADFQSQVRAFETRLIQQALHQSENNRSAAARALGIKRTTLNYRMRQLGLT